MQHADILLDVMKALSGGRNTRYGLCSSWGSPSHTKSLDLLQMDLQGIS